MPKPPRKGLRTVKNNEPPAPVTDDDLILPFQLEKSNVRGRIVRMGGVLAEIMQRHAYPAPVSALLSEVVTVCVMLSAMLKYDGVFTLQIKGDGAVRMLVADVTHDGGVRAYAGFDEDAVKKLARRKADIDNHYYHLLGNKGYIAFTVDQADTDGRYQGIVELKGASIIEAVQHYFTQSEQIKTAFKIAVHPQDGHWKTTALMLQQMPEESPDVSGTQEDVSIEDWTRAVMLMQTCTESELLSPVLHTEDVLYRLFHEEGVRVYKPAALAFRCRCSEEKVEAVIKSIPRAELEAVCEKEGQVSITCEFCNQVYGFTDADLGRIYD